MRKITQKLAICTERFQIYISKDFHSKSRICLIFIPHENINDMFNIIFNCNYINLNIFKLYWYLPLFLWVFGDRFNDFYRTGKSNLLPVYNMGINNAYCQCLFLYLRWDFPWRSEGQRNKNCDDSIFCNFFYLHNCFYSSYGKHRLMDFYCSF